MSGPARMRPRFVLLALCALAALPAVRADCWVDDDGFEHCNMSWDTKYGVIFALVAAFMILLCAVGIVRRRRVQRANLAYITRNRQSVPAAPLQGTYAHNLGYARGPTQYPAPVYAGNYYAPPPGPPPPHDADVEYPYPPPPSYSGYAAPPPAKEAV